MSCVFLCTRRSCLAVEFCWLAVKVRCCSAECLAVSGFLQFQLLQVCGQGQAASANTFFGGINAVILKKCVYFVP